MLTLAASVTDGANLTAVAHLTYTGDPNAPGLALSTFVNDVSPIQFPQGRLALRHTANAPTVTAELKRLPIYSFVAFPGFSNSAEVGPGERLFDLNRGTLWANLLVGGDVVFSSDYFTVTRGANLAIYAIGDFFTGSFQLFVQQIQ